MNGLAERGGRAKARATAIAQRLFALLFEHVALQRKPDFIVGERTDPYLLRWWLLPRNSLFNVYLHCFMRSDDDRALHDHPWPSLSLTLEGGVLEHTIAAGGVHYVRAIRPGEWRLRSARFAHRLELPVTPGANRAAPCWTLFFTGPRLRGWGFHCEQAGWVPYEVFTDTTAGHSITGRGCD